MVIEHLQYINLKERKYYLADGVEVPFEWIRNRFVVRFTIWMEA